MGFEERKKEFFKPKKSKQLLKGDRRKATFEERK